MKFGGASVRVAEQFAEVASLIQERRQHYDRLVVVVSAMGDTTDELLALARRVHPQPPEREQDMLITVGERISISLLAMALALKGVDAISLTGSQSGIITSLAHSEARILEVRGVRLERELAKGRVGIVAGFQGVSRMGEITTLGRGGSDTSAVALAVALGAEKVEFFKDVNGIYSQDPKTHPSAHPLPELSYAQAIEIVQKSGEVLHPRAILLAEKNRIPLHVVAFHEMQRAQSQGTWIREPQESLTSQVGPIGSGACVYEGES